MDTKFNGKVGLSASLLKTFAIIGMTLDHIGIMFSSVLTLEWTCALYALGGLTFPIMAYFIGEGYRKTSDFKKYALRLFIFALIAQIPFTFLLSGTGNVLFTLLLGLITIHLYETMENRMSFKIIFACFIVMSVFLDWAIMGVPMVLLYHTEREKGRLKSILLPLLFPLAFGLTELMLFVTTGNPSSLPSIFYIFIGSTLSAPLLYNYNGQKGKTIKYLFYIYYPLHIMVIAVIRYFLLGWF